MHPVTLYFILVLPLFVFFIIEAYVDFKTAGISAILTAIMLALIHLLSWKALSLPVAFSTFLFLLCGFLALLRGQTFYFKIEPALFSISTGLILLIASWSEGPFLTSLLPKYLQSLLAQPKVLGVFAKLARVIGVSFVVRSILLAIATRFQRKRNYIISLIAGDVLVSIVCLLKIFSL